MPTQPRVLQIPKAPLMFVDIEAGRQQAYIWLISVLVEGRPSSFRPFYAETPDSERGILDDFLSYRKEFRDCTICHYGGLDERLTLRQMATYGLDYSDLAGWFDLQSAIDKSRILSTKRPSLKTAARCFGYDRRSTLDGISVPSEYERVVCKHDEVGAKRLQEYGREDVDAMQHIVSRMDDAVDVSLDRFWTVPERTPPPLSFEEQCALAKSLADNGMNKIHIADRLGITKQYVSARLEEKPEEWKDREVSFERRCAIRTGILAGGAAREYGLDTCKDSKMYGVVTEQVSKNAFRVRSDGAVFQVHKDCLNGIGGSAL